MVRSGAAHPSLGAKLGAAIDQLVDYRESIDKGDEAVRESLRRSVGLDFMRPKLAVVIGRRPVSEHELDDLARRLEQRSRYEIEVVTYDDLLDAEQRRILLQASLAPDL